MSYWKIILVSILVSTAITTPIQATTLRKLSLSDLTSGADVIVVGKCEQKRCIWRDRKIYTVVTVRIERSLKGRHRTNEVVEVHVLGGQIRKPIPVRMQVQGAAHVTVGEEMVLFLKKEGKEPRRHSFVGMFQGKFTVKQNKEDVTAKVVTQELSPNVKLVGPAKKKARKSLRVRNRHTEKLDAFLERVKALARKSSYSDTRENGAASRTNRGGK
jgi:hypothetical protein